MNEGRSIDREAFEASMIAVTGCLVAMSCSLQDFCRMKNAKKERKMAEIYGVTILCGDEF